MRRIAEDISITVSEDNVSSPTEIKFKTDYATADATTCSESTDASGNFPVGTTPVSLGTIAAGKFLSVKPDEDVVIEIDGEAIAFKADKRSIMWIDFTTLDVIVSGLVPVAVSIFIAGD